jgi:hypothetical protein
MDEPGMKSTAADFLHKADEKFRSGYRREAAGLMWEAAQATFAGLAQTRGLEYGDLIELAKALEADGSVPKYHYRGGLVGATLLRDHAEMDVLEAYELDDAYEATRIFVNECFHAQR